MSSYLRLTYSAFCIYNIQAMKQVTKLEKLENHSYFNTETLSQLTDLSGNSLYKNISRWVDQGILINLKKGLYITKTFYDKQNKTSYLEFISNKLRYPSYLSLEYVLNKNQVLTESVYAFTSVTQKSTRLYTNKLGVFSYKNISEKLFTGYTILNEGTYEIAMASKSKALFDYIYLKLYRNTNITKSTIDDLRLNLDGYTKKDREEFAIYCNILQIKKFNGLDQLVFN